MLVKVLFNGVKLDLWYVCYCADTVKVWFLCFGGGSVEVLIFMVTVNHLLERAERV